MLLFRCGTPPPPVSLRPVPVHPALHCRPFLATYSSSAPSSLFRENVGIQPTSLCSYIHRTQHVFDFLRQPSTFPPLLSLRALQPRLSAARQTWHAEAAVGTHTARRETHKKENARDRHQRQPVAAWCVTCEHPPPHPPATPRPLSPPRGVLFFLPPLPPLLPLPPPP